MLNFIPNLIKNDQMALTPSNMLALGTTAPAFNLPQTNSNKIIRFENCKGQNGTVVIFMCNHCPFVIHIMEGLVALANEYKAKGLGFVAISSNDIENYPQDGPNEMEQFAEHYKMPFPYLYDASQEVAKAYDAACTPDLYVFNTEDKLVYRGQLDGSRPNNGVAVTGEDLRLALNAVIENRPQVENQKPSMGCGIKWKK